MGKHKKEYLHDGFVKIYTKDFKGRRFEILDAFDAVGAIILDKNNKVLLVNQFRVPLGRNTTEIPAGVVDINLNKKEIMVLELQEECDLKLEVDDLHELIAFHPFMGITDSKTQLYYGKVDFEGNDHEIHDDLDVHAIKWLDINTLLAEIDNGTILDIKTQIALHTLINKNLI